MKRKIDKWINKNSNKIFVWQNHHTQNKKAKYSPEKYGELKPHPVDHIGHLDAICIEKPYFFKSIRIRKEEGVYLSAFSQFISHISKNSPLSVFLNSLVTSSNSFRSLLGKQIPCLVVVYFIWIQKGQVKLETPSQWLVVLRQCICKGPERNCFYLVAAEAEKAAKNPVNIWGQEKLRISLRCIK